MKKAISAILLIMLLTACGSMKTYNKALNQIELGMTKEQVVGLMGNDYSTTGVQNSGGKEVETLEYKDMFKFHWFFTFVDGHLNKWWKETEDKK